MSPDRDERPAAHFITLGCKSNRYDSAALMAMAEGSWRVTDESVAGSGPVVADVYVINTCAVTERSAFQCRQMVRRVRKWNPGARVVVTGCLAEVSPEDFKGLGADLVAGTSEREAVVRFLGGEAVPRSGVFFHPGAGRQFRGRAVVKVQDGCNQRCAYCVVPLARGPSRSVAPEAVLGQLRAVAGQGFGEAVLTGIHLGLYGADMGTSLVSLLQKIEAEKFPLRLRLSSLEPQELSDELIAVLAESPIICPHLHLPLQSGDAEILSRMGRPYTPENFAERLARYQAAVPNAGVGLDLIAGFPGETDASHRRTAAFVSALSATYFHVFPFSARPGTRAADLPGRLPPEKIKERARELREIGAEKKRRFLAGQAGRTVEVLAERWEDGWLSGTSGNYARVRFAGPAEWRGRLVGVVVERTAAGGLEGRARVENYSQPQRHKDTKENYKE